MTDERRDALAAYLHSRWRTGPAADFPRLSEDERDWWRSEADYALRAIEVTRESWRTEVCDLLRARDLEHRPQDCETIADTLLDRWTADRTEQAQR